MILAKLVKDGNLFFPSRIYEVMMKPFFNTSTGRLFKWFLFLTLGLPVLLFILVMGVALAGFPFAILLGLCINYAFFKPVSLVFGKSVVPFEEFGPNPSPKGFIAAILFYIVVSYCLAFAISRCTDSGWGSREKRSTGGGR